MQTQRQQFIKSTRRKHSPKYKLQNGISSQCQHKNQRIQNQELLQKQEEYPKKMEEKTNNKTSDIVSDLKYQLSFLKDQIAKISTQNGHKKQNQINQNNRLDEYYFPNLKTAKQASSKVTSSIHNSNSQEKIQSLKFKKLKNLQKRIKSVKSAEKLIIQREQQSNNSQEKKAENIPNSNENFNQELKKTKNRVSKQYQNNFRQLATEYTIRQNRAIVNDTDQQIKINQRVTQEEQSSKEQQNNKNVKAAYELKSMKMKKTIKDSSIQIQNLNHKLKQERKHNEQIMENQRQHLTLIQVLQRELSLSKMKIMTLQNAEKELINRLKQAELQCKCKELQIYLKQKQNEIICLQQKIQKQQCLIYNKQLQNLKLQRTIINLQKEKYNQTKFEQQRYQMQAKQAKQAKLAKQTKQAKQSKEIKFKQVKQKQNLLINNSIKKGEKIQKNQRQMSTSELKQIIKIQQKSLINLQSDLRYLQHELMSLTGVKMLCKRQTKLLGQLNEKICQLQVFKSNQKYKNFY